MCTILHFPMVQYQAAMKIRHLLINSLLQLCTQLYIRVHVGTLVRRVCVYIYVHTH
jgi:hypothetical protein